MLERTHGHLILRSAHGPHSRCTTRHHPRRAHHLLSRHWTWLCIRIDAWLNRSLHRHDRTWHRDHSGLHLRLHRHEYRLHHAGSWWHHHSIVGGSRLLTNLLTHHHLLLRRLRGLWRLAAVHLVHHGWWNGHWPTHAGMTGVYAWHSHDIAGVVCNHWVSRDGRRGWRRCRCGKPSWHKYLGICSQLGGPGRYCVDQSAGRCLGRGARAGRRGLW
mmetsp:Transcript_9392/g.15622  ORF Transcript_9392/g.15622 Transcript_9392/m.15622 type:complete len:215 (+) Transcript_9392:627-1271(+)